MCSLNDHKDFSFLVVALIALTMLTIFFFSYISDRSEKNEKELERWSEIQAVYREQLVDAENVSNVDSLVKIIRCNQIYIIDRQTDLINDIRQEANNNIEKLSLWLAYALGLISIFGVFIPLVVQYAKNKDFDTRFNILRDNAEKEIGKRLKEIESERKVIEDMEGGIKNSKKLMEMRSAFITLSSGIQQRLVNNQPERERLLHYLWKNAIDAFAKVVEHSFKEDDHEKRRSCLIDCLILIFRSINELKCLGVTKRTRKLENALDEIRGIIHQIDYSYNNEVAWSSIRKDIDTLINELIHLNFFSQINI